MIGHKRHLSRFGVVVVALQAGNLRPLGLHGSQPNSIGRWVDGQKYRASIIARMRGDAGDVRRGSHFPVLPHENGGSSRRTGSHDAGKHADHQSSPCVVSGGVGATDSTQSGKGIHSMHRHSAIDTSAPQPINDNALVHGIDVIVARVLAEGVVGQSGGALVQRICNFVCHGRSVRQGAGCLNSHFFSISNLSHVANVGRHNKNHYVHGRLA